MGSVMTAASLAAITARRIEQLEAQIDGLVYEFYGLTEEEVGVVEGRGV
jgi:hypothetical protein